MGKTIDTSGDPELRQLAEKHLEAADKRPETLREMTPEKTANLIHELQVHQIELKMQNDELRRTQNELEKTRDRYAHLYDFSPNGYLTINEKGLIHEANLTIAAMLGVDRSVLIGQPFSRFILKDDQDLFYLQRQKLLETEVSQSCDLRLERKEGLAFYAHIKCMVFKDKKDGSREIRAAVSDITERKQAEKALLESEKKYRFLAENMMDMVWLLGTDFKTTYVSPSVENVLGFTPEERKQQSITEVVTPDSLQKLQQRFTEELQYDKEDGVDLDRSIVIEVEYYRKDGTTVWMENRVQAIRDSENKIVGMMGVSRDLTERKKAEEEIQKARREWEDIFQAIGHSTLILDGEHQLIYANAATEKATGKREKDLVGKKCYEIFHNIHEPPKGCPFEEMMGSGHLETIEMEMEAIGGTYLVSCTPMLDDKGRIEKVIHIATDISERKRVEEMLKASEERHRMMIEHMSSGVAVYETNDNGASFVFKEFNPAAEKISRIKREEVIGRDLLDLFPKMDRFGLMDALKKVWRTGKDERLYAGYYRDDQRQGWRDNRIYKLPSGEVVAIYDDVTEQKEMERQLKESEERFRTVADFTYNWEYWVAPDGHTLYVSPSCERITGYGPEAFISDPGLIAKRVHPDDRPAFIDHIHQMEKVKQPSSFDFRILTRNGEVRWISHSCQPVYGSQGQYLGQRASNRDISKRKRMEEALRQSQKMEAIATLTGGIAHDYNNLMSIIMGNLSMAMEDAQPGSAQANCLNEANIASRKVRDLTHELMSLSRGGAPVKEVGSLTELLRNAVEVIPNDRGISFNTSIAQDLWPVPYDPHKMVSVFRNVLVNGVEAMPEGGVITTAAENLRIEDKEQYPGLPLIPGDYVHVSIQDQGAGIPEAHLSQIFDPYFSTKAMGVQKGMGLGLATAYAIVQKHGGHIAIASSPGAGTTVNIYLPAEGQRVQTDLKTSSPDESPFPMKRVLVMDDEEMLRNLARQMLERMGYAVETVEDGVEAIEMYKKQEDSGTPFDAVILDLTIKGGMGGEPTMRELLEIDPDVKAIVSSGYFNDPVMSDFEKFGFMGALAKPYDKKALKEVLERLSE